MAAAIVSRESRRGISRGVPTFVIHGRSSREAASRRPEDLCRDRSRQVKRSRILDRSDASVSRHGSSGLRRAAALLAPPVDDEPVDVSARQDASTANTQLTPGQAIVSRESFADTELPEDHVKHILYIDGADDSAQAVRCETQLLGPQFLSRCVALDRLKQMAIRIAEQFHMAQP